MKIAMWEPNHELLFAKDLHVTVEGRVKKHWLALRKIDKWSNLYLRNLRDYIIFLEIIYFENNVSLKLYPSLQSNGESLTENEINIEESTPKLGSREMQNHSLKFQIKTYLKARTASWTSSSKFPYLLGRKEERRKKGRRLLWQKES